ncbi:MAG: hypothetical protein ROO76_13315 [Terriglobia bacterium]|jgi:hypothetical protein|nr:hypothetical protein [Terriglobia bacterium]
MTSWIISMFLLVSTGIGGSIITNGDQDRIQLQDPIQQQDRLHDGSCQTSSLITFTQFNS